MRPQSASRSPRRELSCRAKQTRAKRRPAAGRRKLGFGLAVEFTGRAVGGLPSTPQAQAPLRAAMRVDPQTTGPDATRNRQRSMPGGGERRRWALPEIRQERSLQLAAQPFPQIAVLLTFGNGRRGPHPDVPDGGKHSGSPRAGEHIRNEVDRNLPSRPDISTASIRGATLIGSTAGGFVGVGASPPCGMLCSSTNGCVAPLRRTF